MNKLARIEYLQNKEDRCPLSPSEKQELTRLEDELLAHAKALSDKQTR